MCVLCVCERNHTGARVRRVRDKERECVCAPACERVMHV